MPFSLAHPLFLLLLPLALLVFGYSRRDSSHSPATIGFSQLDFLRFGASPRWYKRLSDLLMVLALILAIFAIARPQKVTTKEIRQDKGIDILLTIDTSKSMDARDLVPNRLEAAKQVSQTFVDSRPHDRIGLVIYSGIAYTQCPLTYDHEVLKKIIQKIRTDMVPIQGTAIGNSIATSVNHLKDLDSKSKVMILITDGRSNVGEIQPEAAAELAKEFGVKIYTIGVGTRREELIRNPSALAGLLHYQGGFGLDEPSLKKIASTTGGKYFRATDNNSLLEIYKEIDRLEKNTLPPKILTTAQEYFPWFLGFSLLFLSLSIFLKERGKGLP